MRGKCISKAEEEWALLDQENVKTYGPFMVLLVFGSVAHGLTRPDTIQIFYSVLNENNTEITIHFRLSFAVKSSIMPDQDFSKCQIDGF